MTSNDDQTDDATALSSDRPSMRESASGWLHQIWARLGLGEQLSLREKLEVLLKEEAKVTGEFSPEELDMLGGLLRFGGSRVDEVMVPRTDIVAIEEMQSLGDLILLFEESGVSRIPIYHDTLDDPRGMIHIKDLFRWVSAEVAGRALRAPTKQRSGEPEGALTDDLPAAGDAKDGAAQSEPAKPDLSRLDMSRPIAVLKLKKPVLYVPPSMPAMNLLVRMQATRIHMALVVDEYGGTDGLVTIEDLVEQIVGDIEDEHDEEEADLIVLDPRLGLVASGRAPVEDLEERLGFKFLTAEEEAEIDTLGGLVFSIVGRVPARGELIRHSSGVEFEVLDADPRRVKRLKIHVPRMPASDNGHAAG
ncbi:MAG TPA: hemolysin family protein [Hyphomicrobium sp.]|nr:hemolysin family protein [Hyphomicrobium sp.]HRO50636.1 hemolysin family protein [Hyphomicrobium sp.]